MSKLILLAFGQHNRQAPRHWNIRHMLEEKGWKVSECHTTKRGYLRKCADLWREFHKRKHGARSVLVTFPGHHLVPLAWFLTRYPRRTLIFDAFLSVHDTLVSDRRKFSPWNPVAWFLYLVDFTSYHLADEVLVDTEANRQFFIQQFHLKPDRVFVVYLGTRNDLFYKQITNNKKPITNQRFNVLFYGTYIPLQGIEHIIEAARILAEQGDNDIHFTLVGSGQTHGKICNLAKQYDLKNITFKDRVPYEQLPDLIHTTDLCLGIFGTSDKASRVIPHKVYDAAACGVPVLTRDSPAIREKFSNGKEVTLCNPGDPEDIVEKILRKKTIHE